MALIKLVEDYSVTRARNYVRESLQAHGEQCILLSMYHPTDHAPVCPNCSDDIYDTGSNECPICYGSGYNGGVKYARRVWALFTDKQAKEDYQQRGSWPPDAREMQTEAFPELLEHDYAIRVRHWSAANVPLELEGFYGIGQVTPDSLRTGNRFGQFYWDIVGQRAPITKLADNVAINKYPILGQAFPEVTWTGPSVKVPVVPPESKAIFYPQPNKFVAILGDGEHTEFDVLHDLGTEDVVVAVYNEATGEEVDADVIIVDGATVHIRLGDPPPDVDAYRAVIKA